MKTLITGATGGLGTALTVAFWNFGADLLLVGRSRDRLNELRCGLPEKAGQTIACLVVDLASSEGPGKLIAAVRERWTRLDVLVNNAGILGPVGPVWENDWAAWEEAMRVNLLAPVQLCRALIPMMPRGSSIINISGGGATSPRPNFSAYGASKGALVRFSENLAVEAAPLGIRVNCIAPGIMRTHMVEQVVALGPERSGIHEFGKARAVIEAGGTPPEMPADLAVLLASDRGKDITGKLLSAQWDPWRELPEHAGDLSKSDVYTLRRIIPSERGMAWADQ